MGFAKLAPPIQKVNVKNTNLVLSRSVDVSTTQGPASWDLYEAKVLPEREGITDVQLAERVGHAQPRNLRAIIRKMLKNRELIGAFSECANNGDPEVEEVAVSYTTGKGSVRWTTGYILSKWGAIKVTQKLKTPQAEALKAQINEAFRAQEMMRFDPRHFASEVKNLIASAVADSTATIEAKLQKDVETIKSFVQE